LDSKAHAFFCKLDKAFFNRLVSIGESHKTFSRTDELCRSLFQQAETFCDPGISSSGNLSYQIWNKR